MHAKQGVDVLNHKAFGQVLYSIAVGVVGNLVLAVFIGGIFTIGGIASALPWMVGFNAAMTGYMMTEKTTPVWTIKTWAGAVAGGAGALISCGLLEILARQVTASPLLVPVQYALAGAIGLVCGAFGCWLAKKYLTLNK